MYVVQHWSAGYNPRGEMPYPGNVVHGVTAVEAVAYLVEHMRYLADVAGDEGEARALRNAADFYDAASALPDHDKIIAAMEEGARLHGPTGLSGFSHITAGVEFWALPCFTENCDQVTTEED